MRKGRFCAVCGRATQELLEGKCHECFVKEKKLVVLPEKIEARLCKHCLSYFRKGKWISTRRDLRGVLENAALDAVRDALRIKELAQSEAEVKALEIKESSPAVHLVRCEALVRGKLAGREYSSRHETEVRACFELCGDCSRKSGGYYESILQVRGEKALSQEDREMLQSRIEGMLQTLVNKDRRAFLTKLEDRKEGLDFYFGSTKAARKIAHELQKEFGGSVSESPKLAGKAESGEDLYRVSIAIRLPKFKRGDVIELGAQVLEVLGFSKDRLSALDLKTRKRMLLPLKSLKEARTIRRKDDILAPES